MVGLGIGTAFLVSLLWSVAALRLGPRLGFVDVPDDPSLKVHRLPAVPLGGVGILLATSVGWLIVGEPEPRVLVPAAATCALGLLDDRFQLSAWVRLGGQLLIAAGAVATGAFGFATGQVIDSVLAVGLILVSVNAVNLFDGLDSLAGSAALISALGIGLLAMQRGVNPNLAWLMAASIVGFLLLNRPPARVFLGDNGSYLVGFLLAVGVLRTSPGDWGSVVVAAILLGVFLLDLVITVVRRAVSGQRLFQGDRSHSYDRMVDRGWSVSRVVLAAAGLQLLFVAGALLIDAAVT